jgi:hypothetical protein
MSHSEPPRSAPKASTQASPERKLRDPSMTTENAGHLIGITDILTLACIGDLRPARNVLTISNGIYRFGSDPLIVVVLTTGAWIMIRSFGWRESVTP